MKTWGRPEKEGVKVSWSGKIISVQPRIRLTRSFDQRTHSYLGYILTVQGVVGGEEQTFKVRIDFLKRKTLTSLVTYSNILMIEKITP